MQNQFRLSRLSLGLLLVLGGGAVAQASPVNVDQNYDTVVIGANSTPVMVTVKEGVKTGGVNPSGTFFNPDTIEYTGGAVFSLIANSTKSDFTLNTNDQTSPITLETNSTHHDALDFHFDNSVQSASLTVNSPIQITSHSQIDNPSALKWIGLLSSSRTADLKDQLSATLVFNQPVNINGSLDVKSRELKDYSGVESSLGSAKGNSEGLAQNWTFNKDLTVTLEKIEHESAYFAGVKLNDINNLDTEGSTYSFNGNVNVDLKNTRHRGDATWSNNIYVKAIHAKQTIVSSPQSHWILNSEMNSADGSAGQNAQGIRVDAEEGSLQTLDIGGPVDIRLSSRYDQATQGKGSDLTGVLIDANTGSTSDLTFRAPVNINVAQDQEKYGLGIAVGNHESSRVNLTFEKPLNISVIRGNNAPNDGGVYTVGIQTGGDNSNTQTIGNFNAPVMLDVNLGQGLLVSANDQASTTLNFNSDFKAVSPQMFTILGNSTININPMGTGNVVLNEITFQTIGKAQINLRMTKPVDSPKQSEVRLLGDDTSVVNATVENPTTKLKLVKFFRQQTPNLNLTLNNEGSVLLYRAYGETETPYLVDTLINNGGNVELYDRVVNRRSNFNSKYVVFPFKQMLGKGGVIQSTIDVTKNQGNTYLIVVTDKFEGTHTIELKKIDNKADPTPALGSVLALTPDSKGEFKVAGKGRSPLYWKLFTLQRQAHKEGSLGDSMDVSKHEEYDKLPIEWVLAEGAKVNPEVDPTPEVDTAGGLDNALYFNMLDVVSNDTLRQRLGELRENRLEKSVWARTTQSYFARQKRFGFKSHYQRYEFGADYMQASNASSETFLGGSLQLTHEQTRFNVAKVVSQSVMGSLYRTQIWNNGNQLDLIARVGNFRGYLSFDDPEEGYQSTKYHAPIASVSAEFGRQILWGQRHQYYFMPQAQLTYGVLKGFDYAFGNDDNKVAVHSSTLQSLLGRVGFELGGLFTSHALEQSRFYVKANVLKDFMGTVNLGMTSVALNEDNAEDTLSLRLKHHGVLGNVGTGLNYQIGKKTYVYGDLTYTFGHHVKLITGNVGLRYNF